MSQTLSLWMLHRPASESGALSERSLVALQQQLHTSSIREPLERQWSSGEFVMFCSELDIHLPAIERARHYVFIGCAVVLALSLDKECTYVTSAAVTDTIVRVGWCLFWLWPVTANLWVRQRPNLDVLPIPWTFPDNSLPNVSPHVGHHTDTIPFLP